MNVVKKLRIAILSAGLAVALAASFGLWRWIAGREKLNVLLITLDTTRADRLGCYGYDRAETPALDRLARNGTLFTRTYSHVPLTLPSHATILTGLLPPEHGVRDNGRGALDPSFFTLAVSFRARGYRTAAFLASFVLDKRFGLNRGFDTYEDRMQPAAKSEELLEMRNTGDVVCDRALAWLRQNGDNPFFCWVHFYDPHFPCTPPEIYRSRHKDPYDGTIAFMDAQIKRLTDLLDSQGLSRRTLIVVCGDHGESFGEHREIGHGNFVYNATLRVPLLLCSPGRVPSGRTDDRMAGLEDVAPTVERILGWKRPKNQKGEDLLRESPSSERYVYAESQYLFLSYGWAPLYSLTGPRWKFIRCPDPELYDLKTDPTEKVNLLASQRDLANELSGRLDRTRQGMTMAQAGPVAVDERARKALQSLGYLAGGSTTTPRDETDRLKDPKAMIDIYNACQRAQDLLRDGRFQDVVSLLDPLVANSPESLEILKDLILANGKLKRHEEVTRHVQAALAIAPRDRMLLLDLAMAKMAQGGLSNAVQTLRGGLALPQGPLEPTTASGVSIVAIRLRANLGKVLCQLGELTESEAQCDLALKDDPSNFDAHATLANIRSRQGRSKEAIDHYQAALSVNPTNAFVLSDLGVALMRAGRIDEAIATHRRAMAISPESVDFRQNLGAALAANRQQEEALRVYEEGLTRGKSAELYQGAAEILDGLGRTNDAITAYRHVLELDPRAALARNNLGLILCQKKQYADALAMWREGLKREPGDGFLAYNMVWWLASCPEAHVRNGKEALAWAEKLRTLSPAGDPQVLDALAAAYAESGQFDRAVDTATKALAQARDAGNAELAAAIERRLALYAVAKPYHQ